MTIKKKIGLMLAALVGLTALAVGIYVTTAYRFSTSELAKTFKDYRQSSGSVAISKNEPFSVLLMGVDTGSGSRSEQWKGNSDSMLLVTVNPETERTTITSLERDTLVRLDGPKDNPATGMDAKLNAAYANGGAEMAIATVEGLLDLKIDYYMQINMTGLVDLVDAVGGITVTNDFDFPIRIDEWEPEYTAQVAPGTHKINGDQALVYARMRYDDPDGDYGRQKRQRQVIEKIVKKFLALDSLSSYRKILRAVSSNMQTDIEITSRTIPSLLRYQSAVSNLSNHQLHGEDADLPDGSYQAVKAKHLLETQNRIKEELGLKTSKTLKTNAFLYEQLFGLELDVDLEEEEMNQEPELNIIEPVEETVPVVPVPEVPFAPASEPVVEVPAASATVPVVEQPALVVEVAPVPVAETPVVSVPVEQPLQPVVESAPVVETSASIVPVVEEGQPAGQ